MAENEIEITSLILKSKSLYIQSASVDDIAKAYRWLFVGNAQSCLATAIPFSSVEDLANNLCDSSSQTDISCLAISLNKTKEMIGIIRFFNWNNHNRSAEIELIINPDVRKNGYGQEALQTLCKYLFETRGLNKVIFHTAEANIPLVALLDKSGFKRDGVLRRHYFSEGEYHDGILFTLLRFEAPN